MPDPTADPADAVPDGAAAPAEPVRRSEPTEYEEHEAREGRAEPDEPTEPAAPAEPSERDARDAPDEPPEREEPNEPAAGDEPAAPRQPFVPGGSRFTPAAPSGTQRLWNAVRQKPDGGQVLVAVLVALLGFSAVLQVRSDDDDALASARRDDLVQILDGLRRQADRLDDHVTELESDRRDLVSGADTEAAALEQAEERARSTGVLAGTIPASGPGIIMTISDPDHAVSAFTMLRAVNELRVAGAEAIQIRGGGNDEAVRVVASTSFENPSSDVLTVGGKELEPPYDITAIGDPGELSGAMTFAGGIVASIEDDGDGADATVDEYDDLIVDVLHEPEAPQYARPAPDDGDDE
ncbi:DUF881 domain-containing protein [Jiangella alkaliphila]|uniref:Uncharacterized conserved protein YlxW, UPF0749 family n=1 Tax=Jiangella alkaliphila TaxID=419479 RepID=A0A1H2L1F7_9ACTN|nr:DUF881 domain-containing protein [Jiangella alkaliphila]SDU74624.1 Uncharacterized conserved protein YlxW, UPF0749 family [Jiangella alkaliphila]